MSAGPKGRTIMSHLLKAQRSLIQMATKDIKYFSTKKISIGFLPNLQETIDHVKKDLMPDFDYDQYEKRQAEWEASQEGKSEKDDIGLVILKVRIVS
jgi:hypothetical protein